MRTLPPPDDDFYNWLYEADLDVELPGIILDLLNAYYQTSVKRHVAKQFRVDFKVYYRQTGLVKPPKADQPRLNDLAKKFDMGPITDEEQAALEEAVRKL